MSTALNPDVFFKVAGFGMLLYLASSAMLRSRISPDEPLFGELFRGPLLGGAGATRTLLRGRYFLPWVGAPAGLDAYSLLPQMLFWGARIGAFLLITGFATFFLAVFLQVGQT